MRLYSYIGFLTLCLAAPVAFGTAAPRTEAKAQLLDHAELLCNNCFFGPSDYYFCFAADNKVLIGYQRTPVLNWRDDTKNYFTRVRKRWIPWASPGETVPISYDAQHIWVERAGGKPVRLTQSYSLDIFTGNQQCRDAVRAKSH
jgi:hypothetical protein